MAYYIYGKYKQDITPEIARKIIDTRIRRGVKLLDKKLGPGWRDTIDLPSLDFSHTFTTILAQIFGEHSIGVDWLGLTEQLYYYKTNIPFAYHYGKAVVENGFCADYRTRIGLNPHTALAAGWINFFAEETRNAESKNSSDASGVAALPTANVSNIEVSALHKTS